jgi:NADPH:quinone reductase-like Zn-dependent oxidoreductase
VNYRNDQWAKALGARCGGFDVIVDGTGGPGFNDCLSLLKPAGRLIVYGGTAGNPPRGLEIARLFFRQVQIRGSTMGSLDEFSAMVDFVSEHRIEPVVDRVFDLDDAVNAHQHMRGSGQMGKIVLMNFRG